MSTPAATAAAKKASTAARLSATNARCTPLAAVAAPAPKRRTDLPPTKRWRGVAGTVGGQA